MLKSISLFTKVSTCTPNLTPEIMPGIWQMLVCRLMVVYVPVISTKKVKTIIGGNLPHEGDNTQQLSQQEQEQVFPKETHAIKAKPDELKC